MNTKVIPRRIGAFVVDLILAWVAVIVAGIALLQTLTVPNGSALGQDGCDRIVDEYPLCFYIDNDYLVGTSGDLGTLVLIGLGAWLLLRVIPQGLSGRTIGKMMFGIRVVNSAGEPPGIGRSLLREGLWIVDTLPTLYLVGLITAASSKQNQRVGDMAASTLVVRAGDTVAATTAPPLGAQAPPAQPVWDPVRSAYVYRDTTGREQIYDDTTGEWRPT